MDSANLTARGVLAGETRIVTGGNGQPLTFKTPEHAEAAAARLARMHDAEFKIVPLGWEDAWRAFHRPVTVGGLWIGPPWLEPPQGVSTVVIDPGRAFGTGAHPTTRLCIELLAGVDRGSLLDIGCGSGVLSVAASRLGFAPIVAVDVDPVAVEVARANAAANAVTFGARMIVAGSSIFHTADPERATRDLKAAAIGAIPSPAVR